MACICGSDRVVKNGAGRTRCKDCGKTGNAQAVSIKSKERAQLEKVDGWRAALPPLPASKMMPKFQGPIVGFSGKSKVIPPVTGRTHIVIPDTQVRKGVPTDHIGWIGQYLADRRPDVIVHLGDHWDLPSLSMHDPAGSLSREGARYADDIEAGSTELARMMQPTRAAKLAPELHFLIGNHEQRIERAINADPRYAGVIGYQDLNAAELGFKVHDFLAIAEIDGVWYSHYFAQPLSGRPYGGTVDNRMNKIAHSFTQGHEQTFRYSTRYLANGLEQHGLVCGACLTPDHRVLTADLRYVPLGDIKAGDKLVSFNENVSDSAGRSRRYRTGIVEAVRTDREQCFAVTLDSGKVFKVTADHRWLTRVGGQTAVNEGASYQWRTTTQLRRGTKIPQLLDEWEEDRSYDAGYLSGIYDGEGCYYVRSTAPGTVAQLTLSQKPGLVLDKSMEILLRLCGKHGYTHTNSRGVASLRVKGGAANVAKVLGMLQPVRLMPKFEPEHLGVMTTNRNSKIVDISPIGEQEIVRIAIDAKTMIVEGYPHHNCYLHDEAYKGLQGNHHWRGIIVKHEVRNGVYDIMRVSLDYLCRKYEGMPLRDFLRKKYPKMQLSIAA